DTNVVDSAAAASPVAPQSGPYRVGSAPCTEALPSPIGPHATTPPFMTASGFVPNEAALHRTRSATCPGASEPTSAWIPCTRAGSTVYFARYWRTLSLSSAGSSGQPEPA